MPEIKGKPPAKLTRSAKLLAQDDLVMSTNNSSIVSKRSVERLYHPNEPHFFRFFVKKFQRRAPLINRGYHLRLHAIDTAVHDFLTSPSSRNKVVINLGCGSDVVPWQCWSRYPDASRHVCFVDVDFPDLMARKREIVLQTPELRQPLSHLEVHDGNSVLLKSDHYYQIGCDLRQISTVQSCLESILDLSHSTILFLAEVSITYMESEAADAVIQWASRLTDDTRFVLLEQLLPDGPDHPFARTMLRHFDKLNTQIKSVDRYPTLPDQKARFLALGWQHVRARNLWHAWADDAFFPPQKRRELDEVEPFDEWEEFALFAAHYCLVYASNSAADQAMPVISSPTSPGLTSTVPHIGSSIAFGEATKTKGVRRFAAALQFRDVMGQRVVANFLGLGSSNRLRSYDLYRPSSSPEAECYLDQTGPSARMCHAITDLGDHGYLLTGGRTSPAQVLDDAWVFRPGNNKWEKTSSLPVPLYRHSTTRLGKSSLALLFGGRSEHSTVSNASFVYHPRKGWAKCTVSGSVPPVAVFGAVLTCSGWNQAEPTVFHGLLAGGMRMDGTIANQTLIWSLDYSDADSPVICFRHCAVQGISNTNERHDRLVNRFGATTIVLDQDQFLVIGGIAGSDLLQQDCDILVCRVQHTSATCQVVGRLSDAATLSRDHIPRPLWIGHSAVKVASDRVAIIGGGATCFSMGTFWTKGIYTLDTSPLTGFELGQMAQVSVDISKWQYWRAAELVASASGLKPQPSSDSATDQHVLTKVPHVSLKTQDAFGTVVKEAHPVVLEGVALGPCVERWTTGYLAQSVEPDKMVTVHECPARRMDFNAKNFRYVTKSFKDFVGEIHEGGKQYLRALSSTEPADKPANLERDFPTIYNDFVLPPELSFVASHLFSSVLRISGPVDMWLHYDVMSNIYCQIQGSKRFILFPPSDVAHLPLAPGASSSSIDVFSSLHTPVLAHTHPHEVVLGPGDVLFIPPLWLHTATPVSDTSVAVNVFFRDLAAGYSQGRDVYGNRDLAAYEKGRLDIARIASGFEKLPPAAKNFYLVRLSQELQQLSSSG